MRNYCKEMERKLKSKYQEFEEQSSPVLSRVEELNNTLNGDYFDFNDISKTENQIARNTSSIQSSVRSYAGSCLDNILDTGEQASQIADNWVDQIPSGIVGDLIRRVSGIKMLFNELNIRSYISSINELLGCLSSSDCNVTNDIQDIMASMEGYGGFTSTGFNLEDLVNRNALPVSTDKVKELEKTAEKTVDTVKSARSKVPENLF